MELGDKIHRLREGRTVSQRELARAVNVSPNSISRIESGVQEPSAKLVAAIADYFGVSVDYLLGRDTHEKDLTPQMRELFERARSAGFVVELSDFFEWLAAKRDKLEHRPTVNQPDEELLALVPELSKEDIKAILTKYDKTVLHRMANLPPEQREKFNEEIARILYYLSLERKVKGTEEPS